MAKYQLNGEFEAVQWNGHTLSEVTEWTTKAIETMVLFRVGNEIQIQTPFGIMTAKPNDYIYKNNKGDIYPCDPTRFESLCELVSV